MRALKGFVRTLPAYKVKVMNVYLSKKFLEKDINYIASKVEGLNMFGPVDTLSEFLYLANTFDIGVVIGPPPPQNWLLKTEKPILAVQIPWSGLDNIDYSYCKELGIRVCNSKSNSSTVAEMAVGLLFSMIKGIPLHDKSLRNGEWHRSDSNKGHFPPVGLSGKTIGYLGFGSVNQILFRMLSCFDLSHCFLNRTGPGADDHKLRYFSPERKQEFFKQCDIVVAALPLNSNTKGFVDHECLANLGESGFLINICRGGIVVEEDLYKFLKARLIRGAAIDTWYQYPSKSKTNCQPSSFPFHELENVVMSPHRAGYCDGKMPHLDDVISNLIRMGKDEMPFNVVNDV